MLETYLLIHVHQTTSGSLCEDRMNSWKGVRLELSLPQYIHVVTTSVRESESSCCSRVVRIVTESLAKAGSLHESICGL